MTEAGDSLVSAGLVAAGPASFLDGVPLVDHHCHGVVADDLDRERFEALLTDASAPPPGTSAFDSVLGFAVRRWCAPVLELPPHAAPDDYLRRRAEMGGAEVNRRFLRAAEVERLLVDHASAPGPTDGPGLVGPAELAAAADASAGAVLRIEEVAEEVADLGVGATDYPGALRDAVSRRRAADGVPVVACRSLLAHRCGPDVDPTRPDDAAVARAADGWLARRAAGGERLRDPVLVRHGVWTALDTGLPLQLPTGFGDADEDLARADPACLAGLARLVEPLGVPLVLLHAYPYHRQAAWMARVFAGVHVDLGPAVPSVGARARAVVAELLELAPYAKVLYASDAAGLAERHLLAALRFRAALGGVLEEACRADEIAPDDAERVARMIAGGNAHRIYPAGPGAPAPRRNP